MPPRSPRHGRAPAALALATLLAACADMPTNLAPAPAEPAADRPFFTGVFLGDAESTPERIVPALDAFERLTGDRPALVKTFHDVSCDFTAAGWCGRVLRGIAGAGATNYVALDLGWPDAPAAGLLAAINAGEADAHLAAVARGIRSLETVVLLEPAWEMNGDWRYAWQGVENGGEGAPAAFVAAWRRIVGVFRREGATNVRWVFNPNVGNPVSRAPTGPAHWNWYGHYYPGDDFVDYVGAHGFNAPRVWGGPWHTFAGMVDGPDADHMLSDLAARFPHKPILIGELASDEGAGTAKAEWIRDAYRTMHAHPGVAGAVWFHMDKEADWRVDSSPSALRAFREAMNPPGMRTAYRPSPTPAMLAAR
jgi:hypothetical protein